jgi:hypothetical protein
MRNPRRIKLPRVRRITDRNHRKRFEFAARVAAAPRSTCHFCGEVLIHIDAYPYNLPHRCDQDILHDRILKLEESSGIS